jgi:hypothetical protein
MCEGLEPALAEHEAALAVARAEIAEARGDIRDAAEGFRAATTRWESLGAGLEHAYAVLGEGRCLAALADPAAETTLLEARRRFGEMGAKPRVEECDALLARASRRTS